MAEKVEEELVERAPLSDITVERLAVNREQIERWNLPTRPTKSTDTRAGRFRRVHGTSSVELDAIPPDELRTLVRGDIESHMDPWRLEQLRLAERSEREIISNMFNASEGDQPR
jgi:hypothetical protein